MANSDFDLALMLSTPREETETHPLGFPVVGIGASAGGLEAIRDLIREIPGDAKLALLVVMHLDPAQPSHLTEILERSSALRAVVAEPDLQIEAGTIYVIPPATSMSVVDGRIQLKPRDDNSELAAAVRDRAAACLHHAPSPSRRLCVRRSRGRADVVWSKRSSRPQPMDAAAAGFRATCAPGTRRDAVQLKPKEFA